MSNDYDVFKDHLKEAYSYPDELNHLTTNLNRRIHKERRRKGTLYGSFTLVAASLFFILLVNTSASFVYALSEIPILSRISQMVLFDDSLKSAIENDYIQYVGLKDENDGIVLELPYVISDEKNLILFFQTDDSSLGLGESYEVEMTRLRDSTTGKSYTQGFLSGSYLSPYTGEENIGLIQTRTTFLDFTLPQKVDISVTLIRSRFTEEGYSRDLMKDFQFSLELEEFKKPVTYPLNKDYVIEGVRLTLDEIQAYPTGTELHFTTFKNNEDEFSPQFDLLEAGRQTPLTYNWIYQEYFDDYNKHILRIDNNLFSEPSSRSLIIRGYNFLEESKKYVDLDMENKTLSRPIENMELLDVEQQEESTTMVFKAQSPTSEPPAIFFEDQEGHSLHLKNFRHTTHADYTSYVYEVQTQNTSIIKIRVAPPYFDLEEDQIEIPLPDLD